MSINWLPEGFRNRGNRKQTRDCDVFITHMKAKDGKYVRIGFHNKAAEAFKEAKYIEVSSPLDDAKRLYFRTGNEPKPNMNKLQIGVHSLSFLFADDKLIDEYIKHWCGRVFEINYDFAEGYYYISREGDDI